MVSCVQMERRKDQARSGLPSAPLEGVLEEEETSWVWRIWHTPPPALHLLTGSLLQWKLLCQRCAELCLCHAGEPQSMNVSDWDALRTPSRLVSALPACKALNYLLPVTMDKRILEVSFLHQLVSPRTEDSVLI